MVQTSHSRTNITKMPRQLPLPAPLPLLPLLTHNPHPLPNLTLHSPHTTALLRPIRTLHILPNNKASPLNPPLHLAILSLNPPNSLHRTPAPTPLHLLLPRRMSRTTPKDLANLLHPHIRREGWAFARVHGGVAGCVVVFVLGELGPHASEDAVARVRYVGDGAVGGRGVQGGEDEFGRVHFGV